MVVGLTLVAERAVQADSMGAENEQWKPYHGRQRVQGRNLLANMLRLAGEHAWGRGPEKTTRRGPDSGIQNLATPPSKAGLSQTNNPSTRLKVVSMSPGAVEPMKGAFRTCLEVELEVEYDREPEDSFPFLKVYVAAL